MSSDIGYRVTMRRLAAAIPLGRLGNQLFSAACVIGCSLRRDLVPLIPEGWEYARWLNLPPEWLGTPTADDVEFDVLSELGHIAPSERAYGQDLGLFAEFSDQIREAFSPSEEARELLDDPRFDRWKALCREGDPVAMSVRRGDIVDLPDFQPVLSVDYYRNALELFPDSPVVAFSDDPGWVQSVLAPQLERPIRVLSGSPPRPHGREYRSARAMDWVDLQLQAMAPHHICANSTYSWMGAWLSGDLSPVFPSRWHGFRRDHIDTSLMFPPEWRKVDV